MPLTGFFRRPCIRLKLLALLTVKPWVFWGLQFHVFVSQRGHGGAFGFGFLLGGQPALCGLFQRRPNGLRRLFTRFGFGFALISFAFFQIFQKIVEALLVFSVVDFLLRFFGHLRVFDGGFRLVLRYWLRLVDAMKPEYWLAVFSGKSIHC